MNLIEAEYRLLDKKVASAAREIADEFHAKADSISRKAAKEIGISRLQSYFSQVKKFAQDSIEVQVKTYIETVKGLGQFPDDEDFEIFVSKLNPETFSDIFKTYLNDPFGEKLHPVQASAMEKSLPSELDAIFAKGLGPLRNFVLEGKAINDRQETSNEKANESSIRNGSELYDDLLPIFRRRKFDSDFEAAFNSAEIKKEPLALLFADIDKFKVINDTHDHSLGDEVLISVAKMISNTVANRGNAYRLSGEEIAVILDNHTANEAMLLAERIRIAIGTTRHSTKSLNVTVSIGVAEFPTHADSKTDLYEKADAAMYEAKRLGRDLVRIHGDAEPERAARDLNKLRKAPSMNHVSDDDLAQIRLDYFKTGSANCPLDGARLRCEATQMYASGPHDLFVECPLCGFEAEIP